MTRTIGTISQPGAAARPDTTGAIIADFRATMGQLKSRPAIGVTAAFQLAP